jgi:hypothetical protein
VRRRLVEGRRVFGCAFPEPRHESVERVGVHGLHEVIVEAGRHRLLLDVLSPIAGERDEDDLLERASGRRREQSSITIRSQQGNPTLRIGV